MVAWAGAGAATTRRAHPSGGRRRGKGIKRCDALAVKMADVGDSGNGGTGNRAVAAGDGDCVGGGH